MATPSGFIVADFYAEMQGIASDVLGEFKQGVINYTPVTPAVDEWDDPVIGTPVTLDAVATGPSKEYLSDLITTSDIEITASVFGQEPEMSGMISIDGAEKEVIAVQQIPAAGAPVAWKIWVKG